MVLHNIFGREALNAVSGCGAAVDEERHAKKSLKTIARYIEAKKPKTLAEAEHMLDLISVMADETILDEGAAESSLAKRLISEPFFP
jgi:hypothetical protein